MYQLRFNKMSSKSVFSPMAMLKDVKAYLFMFHFPIPKPSRLSSLLP